MKHLQHPNNIIKIKMKKRVQFGETRPKLYKKYKIKTVGYIVTSLKTLSKNLNEIKSDEGKKSVTTNK